MRRRPNQKIAAFVAIATTMGVMLFVFALMRTEVPAGSKDVLLIVGGGLLGAYQSIVSWYFAQVDDDSASPSAES